MKSLFPISLIVFSFVSLYLGNRLLNIKEKEIKLGQYEIVINPNVGKFQYLLDKQNGKIWRLTQFTDLQGQPDVWCNMVRINNEDELIEFARARSGL